MWFETSGDSLTNARDALEGRERAEGPAAQTIRDDAFRERRADPGKPLDRGRVGDIEIHQCATCVTLCG